jgi:segregation and condensation protein B
MVSTVERDEKKIVESVLFSAGHPVSCKEIREVTGVSSPNVQKVLKQLMNEYDTERDTAMEIVKAGEKYVMQVKAAFTERSEMISEPELDADLLKTLSLIAFHQPVKQSNLRRLAGEKIYEHVDKLNEMKLVHTKKHRQTEMITLTKLFPEYFGLDVTKPEEIRTFLMQKLTENVMQKKQDATLEE